MNEKNDASEKHRSNGDVSFGEKVTSTSSEKNFQLETIEHVQKEVLDDEDIDIQVVNELASVEDDRTLPCFTFRVFFTGIVSQHSANETKFMI